MDNNNLAEQSGEEYTRAGHPDRPLGCHEFCRYRTKLPVPKKWEGHQQRRACAFARPHPILPPTHVLLMQARFAPSESRHRPAVHGPQSMADCSSRSRSRVVIRPLRARRVPGRDRYWALVILRGDQGPFSVRLCARSLPPLVAQEQTAALAHGGPASEATGGACNRERGIPRSIVARVVHVSCDVPPRERC